MITIEGLSKTYAGTGRPALNDIALQIPKGQYTAFSGAVAPAKVRSSAVSIYWSGPPRAAFW
ncbi:methionine ABC transporter ATP-binding protein [Klebsiella variicola]|uniref:Methionine ABC transporter ATP-binding protein n=1 Tax=Klebsiella variicola TaxID=244366 RepID=A0A7H4MJY5_KLEVA|nr:methionine ABC transporter ATP-binding protein [Klebsiella variicola]